MQRKRQRRKEVSGNFRFPVADRTVKIFGREQRLRTSTFTRDRPERVEEQEILQGKTDELLSPNPLQDDSMRDHEKTKICGLTREFIYRHHVVPRVKLFLPNEASFPIPLEYIDVTRTTCTSFDVMLEKFIDDFWNEDGYRELSHMWSGSCKDNTSKDPFSQCE